MSLHDILGERPARLRYRIYYTASAMEGERTGVVLRMRDRSRWFHPNSGETPTKLTDKSPITYTGPERVNYANAFR